MHCLETLRGCSKIGNVIVPSFCKEEPAENNVAQLHGNLDKAKQGPELKTELAFNRREVIELAQDATAVNNPSGKFYHLTIDDSKRKRLESLDIPGTVELSSCFHLKL